MKTVERTERPSDSHERMQLGKYAVLSHIATGGMGAVYRARDRETGRLVALKVLPPALAENPRLVRRFDREAKAAARLHHGNIVEVYELGVANGTHYIAMELVEGTDLHRHIREVGRIAVGTVIEILMQATRALRHAFRHGIVHRDVKPSNFLLTFVDGEPLVKLTDLGLALDLKSEDHSRLTNAGSTMGTVDYMAPEQARDGGLVDIRSDIYGLGCTAYHMLTGQPPYPEGSLTEKLYKHVHVMPRDPRELCPGLPEDVLVIVGKMLAKRPEERYQNPSELLLDLEWVAHRHASTPSDTFLALADGTVEELPAVPADPGVVEDEADSEIETGVDSRSVQKAWPIAAAVVGLLAVLGAVLVWLAQS